MLRNVISEIVLVFTSFSSWVLNSEIGREIAILAILVRKGYWKYLDLLIAFTSIDRR